MDLPDGVPRSWLALACVSGISVVSRASCENPDRGAGDGRSVFPQRGADIARGQQCVFDFCGRVEAAGIIQSAGWCLRCIHRGIYSGDRVSVSARHLV